MKLHKVLSIEEALEAVAYAVSMRELPDDFDGSITCSVNDEGDIEIVAEDETVEKPSLSIKPTKKIVPSLLN